MSALSLPTGVLDFILALTVTEAVLLGWWHRRRGRGLDWPDLGLSLAPGFFLVLAFRLVAPERLPAPVLLCLACAGMLHAADFYRRNR